MRHRHEPPAGADDIVSATIAHWRHLSPPEQEQVLRDTEWLLRRKHWEGAGGLDLDDIIRVVIAAQAALLILGLSRDHDRYVSAIVVYPTSVVSVGEHAGPIPGTRTSGPLPVHGLAGDRAGPVLIAWDQAERAARHPEHGHNVVFHEFAHKLDTLDGLADGTPPLDRATTRRWIDVCTPIFTDLRHGNPHPPLRDYGATSPAEFFAVATEAFFDLPVDLRHRESKLYDTLRDFYAQDPAARIDR